MIAISEARRRQVRHFGRLVAMEPFRERTWRELLYFTLSAFLTGFGFAVLAAGLFAGLFLAVTFVGVVIIAVLVRGARRLGLWHRGLARSVLGEEIDEPEPFHAPPGFFGWLQAAWRDRTGWRAVAYAFLKVPLTLFGFWFAFSVWLDALLSLIGAVWAQGVSPHTMGFGHNIFPPGYLSISPGVEFFHRLFTFVTGAVLLFVAPWPMRLVVWIDRQLMHTLLGPDAVTARLRSLERARAQTIDSSAATLRRIERDLHDGTQAQLVALAMQLGQAKEKLAAGDDSELDQVRRLIDGAHQGAKDAIVELRDLVRGIHPPALDIGLEGALATLCARSTVPTELSVSIEDRPTPAIEAIAYFCVAELLANVAQHARASQASVSCAQHGGWLRVVVRDDGAGGARISRTGWSSSGLAGLADRVGAVDGQLHITSPVEGPTVITIDLPLHA